MATDKDLSNLKLELNSIKSKKILLGLSGGVDSIFLLDILLSCNIKPILYFVHYNPNDNSKKRKQICKQLAVQNTLIFNCKRVILNQKNFESNARTIRYNLFNEYAEDNNVDFILTAHHKADQLETLYMRYEDKSDWISFIGIRKRYKKIFRPMLNIEKNIILKYVKEKKLVWLNDVSNENLKIRRNNIRIKVLPEIFKNNQRLIDKLYSKHLLCINEFEFLKKKIVNSIKKYLILKSDEYFVVSNKITSLNSLVNFKLFYQHLFSCNFNCDVRCTKSHWKNLYNFISESKTGSRFFINKDISFIKDRENHYIYNNKYLFPKNITIKSSVNNWYNTRFIINDENNENFTYIESINISLRLFVNGIKVRNWKSGDKFYNIKSKSYKRLKKIFIDKKISVFDKARYPIVLDSNDNIIYIPKIYQKYNFIESPNELITLSWVF